MLFAAGFGTRMGALTKTTPKPLIKVGGKALLQHALDLTEFLSIETKVVNTHYHGDQVRSYLDGTDVLISDESEKILETGGGLRNALPLLGNDPVYTLNTDAVWKGPNPLQKLKTAWNPATMDALLLCLPISSCVGYQGVGDFSIEKSGRLKRGGPWVYSGAQILTTDRLHDIENDAFSLNIIWDKIARDGRIYGLPYSGKWCDVGHPEGLELAEKMMAEDV